MGREEDVPGDVTLFLNRGSIADLINAKEREVAKGTMLARWRFVQMIDAELERRRSKNRTER